MCQGCTAQWHSCPFNVLPHYPNNVGWLQATASEASCEPCLKKLGSPTDHVARCHRCSRASCTSDFGTGGYMETSVSRSKRAETIRPQSVQKVPPRQELVIQWNLQAVLIYVLYMRICIYVYRRDCYVYIYILTHTYVYIYVRTHTHTYIRTYVRTRVHTYIHTCRPLAANDVSMLCTHYGLLCLAQCLQAS